MYSGRVQSPNALKSRMLRQEAGSFARAKNRLHVVSL